MGLFNFFNKSKEITIYNVELKRKIALYENAINRCVSIISKMCSKCEIEYFKNENGKVKPVKNDTYYKLNVKANHAAHIGKFDQDVIFYLMSRGITYNNAVALLVKGFLTDDSIYKEEIQQIINKYWR